MPELLWETTLHCLKPGIDKVYSLMIVRMHTGPKTAVNHRLMYAHGARGGKLRVAVKGVTSSARVCADEMAVKIDELVKKGYTFKIGGYLNASQRLDIAEGHMNPRQPSAWVYDDVPNLHHPDRPPPTGTEFGVVRSVLGMPPVNAKEQNWREACAELAQTYNWPETEVQTRWQAMAATTQAGFTHIKNRVAAQLVNDTPKPPADPPKPHLMMGQPTTHMMPTAAQKAAMSVAKLEAALAKARVRAGIHPESQPPARGKRKPAVRRMLPAKSGRKITLED